MGTSFDTSINRILGHEGGYVNDPRDPGGETKWGISKRSYPRVNIKALTREQAIEIYRRDFWTPLRADQFPKGLGHQMLDGAVNSGITNALRWAQRAARVADDGVIGPATLAALKAMDHNDLLMRFLAERLEFMSGLKGWAAFGKGWARRIAGELRNAAEDN